MIHLTKGDLAVLQALKSIISFHIKEVVHQFYKNLAIEPSLTTLINDHSSVERLKETLTIHIQEMFNGIPFLLKKGNE